MKRLSVVIPIALLLLIGLSVASGHLWCYEGFNATIGGIPFRLWRDRVCPDGQSCMIQERRALSANGGEFTGAAIRYGGCFSSKIQSIMSCSTRKSQAEEQMLNDAVLLRGMIHQFIDGLFADYNSKRLENSAKGRSYTLMEFLFEGNSIDEFCNGVVNFLGFIGYDAQEIETPFRDFVNTISSDRSSRDEALVMLLKMMATENIATTRLSHLVLARAIDNEQAYAWPFKVSNPVKLVTGMMYKVLEYLHSNVGDIFEAVSQRIEAKDGVPSINSCHATLRYLAAIEFFASIVDLGDNGGTHDIICNISTEVSQDCMKAYPADLEVRFMQFVIDRMRILHQKNATYDESNKTADEYVRWSNGYYAALMFIPLKFEFPCLSYSPPIPEVVFYPELYQHVCRTRTGDELFSEENDPVKRILELVPNRSCREYVCHSMLCNSHASLVKYNDDLEMSYQEMMGHQEKMAPKEEL